jgi:hypothetical protein
MPTGPPRPRAGRPVRVPGRVKVSATGEVRASESSARHSSGSATGNAAHSRKVRPLGENRSAWPVAPSSLSRTAAATTPAFRRGSPTTRPSRWHRRRRGSRSRSRRPSTRHRRRPTGDGSCSHAPSRQRPSTRPGTRPCPWLAGWARRMRTPLRGACRWLARRRMGPVHVTDPGLLAGSAVRSAGRARGPAMRPGARRGTPRLRCGRGWPARPPGDRR